MWLLNANTLTLEVFQDDYLPARGYTILSHTWDEEEVSFKALTEGKAEHLRGYQKILGCCELSTSEGYDYTWIDTCCIDKTSSAELSEAINSMFKWYYMAGICYAYLGDVDSRDTDPIRSKPFAGSRWFTRGWTLQELIAPHLVVFVDKHWQELGTRQSLAPEVTSVTGIPHLVLDPSDQPYPPNRFLDRWSVAQRLSWAAKRRTTRVEDEAYCLMGLFNVNMPLLYGEGTKAFHRLQKEILKQTKDVSLFAWKGDTHFLMAEPSDLLAPSPYPFRGCGDIIRLASPTSLLLPTKRFTTGISVLDDVVQLRGTPLSLHSLAASYWNLHQEEVNNTFVRNWSHNSLKRFENAVLLVLECGTQKHIVLLCWTLYMMPMTIEFIAACAVQVHD